MIRLRWSFIYVAIVMFAGLSMASKEDDVDKKVTKLFEINWESMRYNKTVTQYNPEESSSRQASSSSEKLTLSCKIEIKDTKLVMGISRKGFLTGLADSKKQNIEINQNEPESRYPPIPAMRNMPVNMPMSRPMDMWYEGLRYQRRFSQPSKIFRWRAKLRQFLGIPQKSFRPKLVNQLEPSHIQFDLDLGLLDTSGGEIRSLKGYYYALMAESIEHVEVPFEPNDQWVSLTDDVAIQVREAKCTVSGTNMRYNYEIEEDRAARRGFDRLSVGDYLPEKLVMGRQFINADGEPLERSMGFGFLPAHIGSSGGGTSSGGPIKKIRFVIAIKPKHCKIPFEIKNIPLPNPESKEEKGEN